MARAPERDKANARCARAALDAPAGACSMNAMSAIALLASQPRPTDEDVDRAMAGNICRCATYVRIRAAIHEAAKELGR